MVVSVSESSSGLRSFGLPVTFAVLLNAPAEVGITTIVTVAAVPFARLPRSQLTVLVPLQPPWLGVADTKDTPPGRGSVTVTPVACSDRCW